MKHRITNQRIGRWAVLGLAALFMFMSGLVTGASAEENVAEIIAVKHSGWASRLHQSVKTTIRPGDLLYQGDMLEVMAGNYVELAFDGAHKNVMHIEGPTSIRLTDLEKTDINLMKGHVFAFLDNQKGKTFKVTTPTAVSAVRGTHFQVKTQNLMTETLVYKGAVEMSGLSAAGVPTGEPVMLNAGQKSRVMGAEKTPEAAAALTKAEKAQAAEALARVDETAKALAASGFVSRIGEEFDGQGRAIQKKKLKKEGEDGHVVF